ncbi:MAG: uroporphyrinogen-III synthase [Pseudomonadota bacterium]
MSSAHLRDTGVLVTRPAHQAHELAAAIEHAGGRAIRFPALQIVALDADAVAAARAAIPAPDVVIFVSRNAVVHGINYVGNGLIAAIGPSTAAAIEAAGQHVDILADGGFDSESLLATPVMQDIAGKKILIVRGTRGREHLGDTLRERGADVHYLATYDRIAATPGPDDLARLESEWLAGRIHVVTVMSVETLSNLLAVLPETCVRKLEDTPLVTPAARVIKEALKLYPASRPVLASGPEVADIVDAIAAIDHTGRY